MQAFEILVEKKSAIIREMDGELQALQKQLKYLEERNHSLEHSNQHK